MKRVLIIILTAFLGILDVQAECSYIEKANLNEMASKVKTNYEVIEEKVNEEFTDPDSEETIVKEIIKTKFKISIYNITKDLYISQKNSLTGETIDIYYENTKDGIYSFETNDIENIIKYDYQIYGGSENCAGNILKSYSFTKPKINLFSQYRICEGLESVPYCRKYITEEIKLTESELAEKLNGYIKTEEPKEEPNEAENGIIEVIKNNYVYVIIGVVAISGALIITIYIVKKRSAL
ncbi:MAG: hypothetical protein GX265_05580 [Mollicutes bacterium]|nr:hypothetical protein [Mollicutes bacterium]